VGKVFKYKCIINLKQISYEKHSLPNNTSLLSIWSCIYLFLELMKTYEIVILIRHGQVINQLLTNNKELAYSWFKELGAKISRMAIWEFEEAYETVHGFGESDTLDRINSSLIKLGYKFIWLTEIKPIK